MFFFQPKWGYLPPAEDDVRGMVCRFCMNQFLRVKEGKWKSQSGYCPLDLFSGWALTLLKATLALINEFVFEVPWLKPSVP